MGLITLFLSWWYSEELQNVLQFFGTFLAYLYDLFSIRTCIKTFFAVWRRDQIDYNGLPLKDIFQAWTLNLASRFIGAVVKSFTIFTYLAISVGCILAMAFFLLGWILFPLVIVGLVYLGLQAL